MATPPSDSPTNPPSEEQKQKQQQQQQAPSIPPTANISTSTSTSTTTTTSNTFTFPREYHFPPFFTLQTNSSTYHAQCRKWAALILAYCRHHRLFKLSVVDAVDTELFGNARLGKRLALADAREMLQFMRREGRAEWVGSAGAGDRERGKEDRNTAWIWWRNPEEWAAVIADWVDATAQRNTVLTLYELTESEATLSQEFHGMDPELLQKALGILVKRGKAQIFGQEDQRGVKFF